MRMTLFDYLASGVGIELTHAVIVVLLAIGGWITYQTRKQSEKNETLLHNHIDEHHAELAHTSPGDVVESDPNM
jgi:cytoskeletal protein RodZ